MNIYIISNETSSPTKGFVMLKILLTLFTGILGLIAIFAEDTTEIESAACVIGVVLGLGFLYLGECITGE